MFHAVLIFSLVMTISGLKLQRCPAGFYCAKSMLRSVMNDDSYQQPQACPRGTWSGAGAVSCTPCLEGEFTWDEASTNCEKCDPGYMCPAPDVDPEPCPQGTYAKIANQICCKLCEAGSYTPQTRSTRCIPCRPGTYCPINQVKLSCLEETKTTTTMLTTMPTTTSTSTTIKLNVCSIGTPCLNGGTCQLGGPTGFRCDCPDLYYGDRCQNSSDEKTITEVFTRNNWTDILAVIDVTGSMNPCAGAVLQWMSLAHNTKTNIKTYVFFNDGDSEDTKDKVIGSTGGIYSTNSTNLSVVLEVMRHAMSMGNGGDGPENDIEALLYGIKECPTCKNVIHIADNTVTPRDMILLPNVTRSVRVVPCQVIPSQGINPALISIADKTRGSIHTIEQDIINLSGIAVGATIDIGDRTYRRTNTGFVRV